MEALKIVFGIKFAVAKIAIKTTMITSPFHLISAKIAEIKPLTFVLIPRGPNF